MAVALHKGRTALAAVGTAAAERNDAAVLNAGTATAASTAVKAASRPDSAVLVPTSLQGNVATTVVVTRR